MKKYFPILTILLFSCFIINAQVLEVQINYVPADATVSKPVIFYSPGVKLNWNDFMGKPDKASDAAAITNAGIGFKMDFHSKDNLSTLNIHIDCSFSKKDSWVKKGMRTDYILLHEQHHFDIAYLFAMKFLHDLKVAKYTMNTYSKVIENIYYSNQTALLDMQNQYDGETKHSQITAMQDMWNKKIDAELDALSKQ